MTRRNLLGTKTSHDRAGLAIPRFNVLSFVPPSTPDLEYVEVYKRTGLPNTTSGDVLVDRERVVDWSPGIYPYFRILQHSEEDAEYFIDYLNRTGGRLGSRIPTEQYVPPAAVEREVMVNGPQYVREFVRRDYVVLETMGERAILLRRRNAGTLCECRPDETRHPNSNCRICYGTGYVGGYDVFSPFLFDWQLAGDKIQLTETALLLDQQPRAWTTIGPELHDRDVIVRLHSQLMDRFEVTNPVRSYRDGVAALPTIQEFTVRVHQQGHPIYNFPVEKFVASYLPPATHQGMPERGL